MKTALRAAPALALVAALLAAAPHEAKAQASSPSYAGCVKPPPPVFPAPATASSLQSSEFDQHRYARDAYFAAADANLACLNTDIEARMRALFASGGAMDATLRAEGLAHEQASRERAAVHEQFLRLCLAYEDTHGPAACR